MTLFDKIYNESQISWRQAEQASSSDIWHYHTGKVKAFDITMEIIQEHSEWELTSNGSPDKFWDDGRQFYCRIDTMGRIEFKILVWRYGDWHNLDLSPLGQKGFTIMPKVTHYFKLPLPL